MEDEKRKISQILVEGQGWVSSDSYGQIEVFMENGEMAQIKWYRKGNKEYNGKYVIQINYEGEPN